MSDLAAPVVAAMIGAYERLGRTVGAAGRRRPMGGPAARSRRDAAGVGEFGLHETVHDGARLPHGRGRPGRGHGRPVLGDRQALVEAGVRSVVVELGGARRLESCAVAAPQRAPDQPLCHSSLGSKAGQAPESGLRHQPPRVVDGPGLSALEGGRMLVEAHHREFVLRVPGSATPTLLNRAGLGDALPIC